MNRVPTLPTLVLAALLGACGSTSRAPAKPADAPAAADLPPHGAPAPDAGERGYTLVHLLTGPKSGQLPKEENDRVFAGHFSNMQRLADAKELLVAGPYGDQRHDER